LLLVAPPSEAQTSRPETEAVVRQPEAQKSGRKATDLAVPQLVLPADVAKKVGQRIWLNETNGNRDAITSWNANEEFASLGIGHFIWFPAGKTATFEEDFPPLLEFRRKESVHLPSWLGVMTDVAALRIRATSGLWKDQFFDRHEVSRTRRFRK
jgi:hypothetical protein